MPLSDKTPSGSRNLIEARMALRLELKQISGTPADVPARRWTFDQGRRTLGRTADCDWQIPDPDRLVSKHHCTIEADRSGFVLRDKSANGTKVDGRIVLEGDSVRLAEGSRIEIGSFVFSVVLSGENERELADPDAGLRLADESLTISSILADVAPRSPRPSRLYGGHDAALAGDGNGKSGERPSRNVTVGWQGPPETNGLKPVLPPDWDSEFGLGNTIEHIDARRVAVPIARVLEQPLALPLDEPEQEATFTEENLPQTLPFTGEPVAGDRQHMAALVGRNERACIEVYEALGAVPPPLVPQVSGAEGDLAGRLEALLLAQQDLAKRIERALDELGRQIEPKSIEAQVVASPKLFWQRENPYWQAYKSRFSPNDGRATLRDLFRQALGGSPAGAPAEDSLDSLPQALNETEHKPGS